MVSNLQMGSLRNCQGQGVIRCHKYSELWYFRSLGFLGTHVFLVRDVSRKFIAISAEVTPKGSSVWESLIQGCVLVKSPASQSLLEHANTLRSDLRRFPGSQYRHEDILEYDWILKFTNVHDEVGNLEHTDILQVGDSSVPESFHCDFRSVFVGDSNSSHLLLNLHETTINIKYQFGLVSLGLRTHTRVFQLLLIHRIWLIEDKITWLQQKWFQLRDFAIAARYEGLSSAMSYVPVPPGPRFLGCNIDATVLEQIELVDFEKSQRLCMDPCAMDSNGF